MASIAVALQIALHLAGGQVGYNWQFNPLWVTSVEADYQWANLTGQGLSPLHLGNVGATSANSSMIANQTINSFGTIRARVGGVVANPLLVYFTAGLAFGHVGETLALQPAALGRLSSGGFSYACVAGARPVSPARRHRRCSAGRSAAGRTMR